MVVNSGRVTKPEWFVLQDLVVAPDMSISRSYSQEDRSKVDASHENTEKAWPRPLLGFQWYFEETIWSVHVTGAPNIGVKILWQLWYIYSHAASEETHNWTQCHLTHCASNLAVQGTVGTIVGLGAYASFFTRLGGGRGTKEQFHEKTRLIQPRSSKIEKLDRPTRVQSHKGTREEC
jgi:hypothetical protein